MENERGLFDGHLVTPLTLSGRGGDSQWTMGHPHDFIDRLQEPPTSLYILPLQPDPAEFGDGGDLN